MASPEPLAPLVSKRAASTWSLTAATSTRTLPSDSGRENPVSPSQMSRLHTVPAWPRLLMTTFLRYVFEDNLLDVFHAFRIQMLSRTSRERITTYSLKTWFDRCSLKDVLELITERPTMHGFRILRCTFRSARSFVFYARQPGVPIRYALKWIKRESFHEMVTRRDSALRIEDEALLLTRWRHPALLRIVSWIASIDGVMIVSE